MRPETLGSLASDRARAGYDAHQSLQMIRRGIPKNVFSQDLVRAS